MEMDRSVGQKSMSSRKIFRIEYILILFAAAIFTSTLVFKTKVLVRFSQFDSELLSLINQIDSLPSGFDMSGGGYCKSHSFSECHRAKRNLRSVLLF